jgi:rubredoxin
MEQPQMTGTRGPTLICESCGHIFAPDDAHGIAILGADFATYGCPECGWTVRSVPPLAIETNDERLTPAITPVNE